MLDEVNAIDGDRLNPTLGLWWTPATTGQALQVQMGNLRGVYGLPPAPSMALRWAIRRRPDMTVEGDERRAAAAGHDGYDRYRYGGVSYFAGVTVGRAVRSAGTGTVGSTFTGLRVWRDSGIGRIGGYASNVLFAVVCGIPMVLAGWRGTSI